MLALQPCPASSNGAGASQPPTLTDVSKAILLNEAGFNLQALGQLADAIQPMQAALEAQITRGDWHNAARAAVNLSDLTLTTGKVALTIEYAKQGVELADRGNNVFIRIVSRASMADAMHQGAHLDESDTLFREAEAMQKEHQPQFPLLNSLQGFKYCDLLLARGGHKEVLERADKFLKWRHPADSLLSVALEHLSVGRAHLLLTKEEGANDFEHALAYLDQAVDGLRQAGHQHYMPRGLLARAELRRVQAKYNLAQRDLDEAFSIAERGGMGLHIADCHMEYARLYLANGDKAEARNNLSTAKKMIGKMGYHRRDGEVVELEGELL